MVPSDEGETIHRWSSTGSAIDIRDHWFYLEQSSDRFLDVIFSCLGESDDRPLAWLAPHLRLPFGSPAQAIDPLATCRYADRDRGLGGSGDGGRAPDTQWI